MKATLGDLGVNHSFVFSNFFLGVKSKWKGLSLKLEWEVGVTTVTA